MKPTQNYPFSLRWEAFLVDLKIMIVLFGVGSLLVLPRSEPETMYNSPVYEIFAGALFLMLIKDILGNSYGKSINNLVIIDQKTGKTAAAWQCALRNLTVLIFPIELFVVLITLDRRIGDWLTGTVVVKNEGNIDTSLSRGRLLQCLVVVTIILAGLYAGRKYQQQKIQNYQSALDATLNLPLSQHLDTVLIQSLYHAVKRTQTQVYETNGPNNRKTVALFVEVRYERYACINDDVENDEAALEQLYADIRKILDNTMLATGYDGHIRFHYVSDSGSFCTHNKYII